MKRLFTQMLMLLLAVTAAAQSEYYTGIDGTKGGETLKTALHKLIKNHQQISYGSGKSSTWGAFYTTDAVIENGKRRVLDMYSNEKRYFGDKGEAVSGMNIEHSVAKSWWGGTKNNAYCDLHHLNPSDQNANSRKSNYPLGELTSVSWDNGVTFVGKANIDGSSQNAYEPCDEYKGDFARVFMYMFTCYQDLTWEYTWMNYEKSTYPTLKPWAVKLLLKWHKQDPVSEKEINRNNAVQEVQGNRNPYVDYPQLADYVWGDSVNYVFHLNGEVENGGSTGGNEGGSDSENKWKEYLNENFDGTSMVFTTQETIGNYPWELSSKYKMAVATSYVDNTNNEAESWMISPAMDFTKDSVAKISFDYVIRYCESGKESEYHSLLISNDYAGDVETATWESIDFEAAANTTSWDVTRINEMVLPEKYMGDHNVTIAFYYKGTSTKAGTFEIDNVVLQAIEGYNNGDDSTTGDEDGDGDDGGDEGGNTGGTEGNNGNFTDGSFTLVTDAARLTVGDSILIAYGDFVMGTDAGNFRNKTDMMTSNGKVTYLAADAQKILLEAGVVEGTFAFNVGDGYLAAKSSSSNHITTATEIDANGSWTITIGNEALAVIEAQGDKTRNTLQYNTSSPRFSCYTGTQKSVNIYAKSPVATGIDSKKTDEESFDVYSLTGNILRSNVTRSEATNGLQLGIYIVNGKKVLVE
ncbi:MAG: endonuclease [Bacteroidaceae bacterium]|nr:endonuclease [Bacteroidaceae bacterium]